MNRTFFATCVLVGAFYGTAVAGPADDLVARSGITGGFVVHLGCGDGRLTAALHANDRFTVQGLDADPANIARARGFIQSQGLYGPVSVEQFDGDRLPYADNLINLMVVEDPGKVSEDEIQRVLVPNGVAFVKRKIMGWRKIVKPQSTATDEWTHFLHDAGNNAVANDTVVGTPRRLQWVAPPLWLRSHETPSGVQAEVSSAGRLFYIFDEGLVGIVDQRLPERWSIVCRDAYNGKLLWKRHLKAWGWREWSRAKWAGKDWTVMRSFRTDVPQENERRLVAVGDRLYATLSYLAPMSILDAVTGNTIATVEETRPAREIVVSDGIAVVRVDKTDNSQIDRRRGGQSVNKSDIVAVDGNVGTVLWRHEVSGLLSMSLAADKGHVFYLAANGLVCRNLHDGTELWKSGTGKMKKPTLVASAGYVFIRSGNVLKSFDATTGKQLWNRAKLAVGYSSDLFFADGMVWGGVAAVDDRFMPARKGDSVLAVGLDPKTGEEKKKVTVSHLRSPEHHHRCYRNKATDRYILTGLEGVELVDLQEDNHSENNWVRGACRLGIMPCNGMLYVPADQCFCEPGSKLLGFAAISPESAFEGIEVPDSDRLEKGPAYGRVTMKPDTDDTGWPTFRHDPSRSGSTPDVVSSDPVPLWRTEIGGKLSAPVAADGMVLVAAVDAHTVYAFDIHTGSQIWKYVAGGRIDSPPTIYNGLVLFGSHDGRVYCLRAKDGKLVWRFMAAPRDRRIGYFGQVESAWPVHGSVLVTDGTAYFTSGRSTYLDGGIRVYGLDPATGKVLHTGLLEGPNPQKTGKRDLSFYLMGANSDVLVAEGGRIFMRQKVMTPDLNEIHPEVLSLKGERDTGLHVFSTSSLLDDSWYNRAYWMYSKRWPSFQLANQAPKTGQMLVVDDKNTYALRVFYRRNVHSPMFFPGKEGYLLFADKNTNEPQIVGEKGARKPVAWLPQSDYTMRPGQVRTLDSQAFGLDKMIGYTRAEPPIWSRWLPVRIRAMVKAGDMLFAAGPPDEFDEQDPYAPFEGRRGARMVAVSAKDGSVVVNKQLDTPPVFDGMIAADGSLIVSLQDGSLLCIQ